MNPIDFPTLASLLGNQAATQPAVSAILSVRSAAIDYAGLWQHVQALAGALRSAGLSPASRVAVVLPNGPEMAVTFLGVASCATCAPLNPAFTAAEFRFYLEDIGASAVVLLREEHGAVRTVATEMGLTLLEIQRMGDQAGTMLLNMPQQAFSERAVFSASQDTALILHTSGTTARPKMVPLTQAQLLASAGSIAGHLALTPADRCLNVMPLFHIHGLVGALLSTLRAGGSVVCTPGFDERTIFDWIAQHHPTWTTAVPTMHQAWAAHGDLYRRKAPEHRFRFVRSSSAALPPHTLRALQTLTGAPVVEAYGMTEASHQMASNPLPPGLCKPGSVGQPAGAEIALMDEAGQLLGQGATGEIVIRGPGVTSGYENNPEANTKAFHDGWFRTGDQGRFDADGYLFITGRLKEIVNRGGEKISPREVDEVLLEHPAVLQATAYAVPHPSLGEDLAAVVVLRAGAVADEAALRDFLFEHLAAHKVPSSILMVDAIPKGPTGKVQRNQLHALLAPLALREAVPVRGPTEQAIALLFGKVLGIVPPGAADNFFALGGDSLKGTALVVGINSHFQVDLPVAAVFRCPTTQALAREVDRVLRRSTGDDMAGRGAPVALNGRRPGMTLQPAVRTFRASPAQQGLWFLCRLAPHAPAYNMARKVSLDGPLDVAALQRAFGVLVARHDVFRTRFSETDFGLVQIVMPHLDFVLHLDDLSALDASGLAATMDQLTREEAQTPFSLDRAPLLRVRLLRLGDHAHLLLLTVHHIISDHLSLGVLWRELSELYRAFAVGQPSPLAPLPMQFADQAERLCEAVPDDQARMQMDFWKAALAGLPDLVLPVDRPRPSRPGYRGRLLQFSVGDALTRQLRTLSQDHETTLFTTLLAGLQVLLFRYSGQEDFAIGVAVSGRNSPGLEGLFGYFARMLVIRADLSGQPGASELIARVHDRVTAAYGHQDLSFDHLVQELAPVRNPSRNPLFQVGFTNWVTEGSTLLLEGLAPAEVQVLSNGATVFDLSLNYVERDGALHFLVEYATDLFEEATIQRMAGHFETLLEGIVSDPQKEIGHLPLLTRVERHQMLVQWNDTAQEYPRDKCIHELFEEQVQRTPDAVALVFEDQQLSYAALNARANQLAHHLKGLGVGPEVLLGICVERSIEMVVGLLGILKAGGAYVPLDPGYPAERLAFMLEDSRAPVLLTQERLLGRLPETGGRVVCLDRDWAEIGAQSQANPRREPSQTAQSLAYVIYTSGSTGQPKGVMIEHRSLLNFVAWLQRDFSLSSADCLLQLTPTSFDISMLEIYWPLSHGARLVIAPPGAQRVMVEIVEILHRCQVTVLQVVPSMLGALVQENGFTNLSALRQVFTGGEALGIELARQFHLQSAAELIDGYGPTETTVYSTFWRCDPCDDGRSLVPIGRPVANTQAYILDRQGEPCPVGVAGELCLGGAGLARGYLNRPELTVEKFVADPYSAVAGARMYRTGDLARYLADGNIEFLGRIDHQVKIRGFRIELGEIETVLGAHPEVQKAVVIAREDTPGDKRLVAYIVAAGAEPADVASLRIHLQERLPDYMRPGAYVALERLPLTPNGKVDRRALPEPQTHQVAPGRNLVPPRDPIEKMIAEVWSDILKVEQVSVHDHFFDLGGHSLLAARVASRLSVALRHDVPLLLIFENPTVEALARAIDANSNPGAHQVANDGPTARQDPALRLPLSSTQKSLWVLDQLHPGGAQYNEIIALRMTGRLDAVALQNAFEMMVERHAILRTRYMECEGDAYQVIDAAGPVHMVTHDLMAMSPDAAEKQAAVLVKDEAGRPFDLRRGPLMRVVLIRLGRSEHVLAINQHHIVTDGWSIEVLLRELQSLYGAFHAGLPNPLAPLPLQYGEHASSQLEDLQGERYDTLLAYWRAKLLGVERLTLPMDRPKPACPSFRGGVVERVIHAGLLRSLHALAHSHNSTVFMALLSAFQVLLMRLSGQDDIAIGSPVANRGRDELRHVIGPFLNFVVLRTDLSGAPTFEQLLGRTRQTVLEALDGQEMPFDKLVSEINPRRELNQNPLFDVMINHMDGGPPVLDFAGLRVRELEEGTIAAKVALTLYIRACEAHADVRLVYQVDLFSRPRVEAMMDQFMGLIEQIVTCPQQSIHAYSLVTAASRKVLPDPAEVIDEPATTGVVSQVLAWAQRSPGQVAVRAGAQHWTYAELAVRADLFARALHAGGVGCGDVVVISGPRSFGVVGAILAVLMSGATFLTIDPVHPVLRQRKMVNDLPVKAVCFIGEASGTVVALGLDSSVPEFHLGPDFLWSTGWLGESDVSVPLPTPSGNDPAYVFFTSGSTGNPKGILGSHKGLSHFLSWQRETFSISPGDRISHLIGLMFDPFLRDVFLPLISGATLCIPTETDLIDTPAWLEREGVTVVHTTPTVMQSWLRDDDRPVALERLRWVFIGGEALTDTLVHRWRAQFPGVAQLVNLYGPTETTMARCFYPVPEDVAPGIQPIGESLPGDQALVLNRAGQLCGVGETGEIVLRTHFRSLGYIHLPEENARNFRPNPFRDDPQDIVYFTGDQGRYRPDGLLDISGRFDDQVKIRGVRVEPGEVSACLMRHEAVRQCIVLPRNDMDGQRQLVAYVVLRSAASADAGLLRAYLDALLPRAFIPAAFVFLDALPQLPNGKIDRRSLPEPQLQALDSPLMAPRTPLELAVAELWCEVLGLNAAGVDEDFFALGGHSLLAIRLVARLTRFAGVGIPARQVFESPTIAGLAAAVDRLRGTGGFLAPSAIAPTGRTGDLALSYAQSRLWFLDRLLQDKSAYNIPVAWRVEGALDEGALQQALDTLVARHEALRTHFAVPQGQSEPVQIIEPAQAVTLRVTDLSALAPAERERQRQQITQDEIRQPFDLEQGPVLRAQLLRLGADEHQLLLNVHHIAADGWSMGVLSRELAALYASSTGKEAPLEALPIQYADYAAWQRQGLQGDVFERQLGYWRAQLQGLATLDLPTDHPRPAMPSYQGARIRFALGQPLLQGLKTLGRREGSTLYMTLLAALQVLLSRYSAQDDIAVGSPIAGRSRSETEGLIGFFVNTLVLRSDLSGNPRFCELLARVRERALQAYAHQDVPFEKLVEELKPGRDASRNPLFQVMFVLQNAADPALVLQGLQVSPMPLQGHSAKFDLSLSARESAGGLHCELEYATDLFEEATIQRMAGHFETLLEGIVSDPQKEIGHLPLLTRVERHQMLVQWNDTAQEYPRDKCIHELFEEQVQRTPDAVALVFEDQQLSYAALNARANRLAHHLKGLGVGPEVLVGICVERSIEMVVGLLGILKAGGAYVPLDPGYPQERLAFMLQDTQAPVLLTQERLLGRLPETGGRIVCLDRDWLQIEASPQANPSRQAVATDIAYAVYTSGSTGRPKGVLGSHRAAVNRFHWMWTQFPFEPTEVCCQKTALSFVDSVWEVFGPLLKGVPSAVIPDANVKDPSLLVQTLAQHRVTRMVLVPSLLRMLLDTDMDLAGPLQALRFWVCSGETFPVELLRRFHARLPGRTMLNLYGSSEVAADATAHVTTSGGEEGPVPIGRPIANLQAYVLDARLQPVPALVAGELYLGGDGLAAGYLGHPALTTQRFMANPFSADPAARWFKTGDQVRYLANGVLVFLGRTDHQVKLRGMRIELGEIESVLLSHPGIRTAHVIVREDDPGDERLVAYVVLQPGTSASVDFRSFLAQKLPEYMVPSAVLLLAEMPLTPSGKTDRKALPAPAGVRQAPVDSYVAPRDALELDLCRVWAEVLGLEGVGVDDNYFDLGGHSLKAVRLMLEVRRQLGHDLPISTLFQAPTVARMASQLRASRVEAAKSSSLVAVQALGDRLPLIVLPGAGGELFSLHHLGEALGPEQPLYVLNLYGFGGGDAGQAGQTLPQIAARIVRDIRKLQPSGPYQLAGYSLGGRIAYEVAQQLRQDGQEVGMLMLLDSAAPGHAGKAPLRVRVLKHLRAGLSQGPRRALQYFAQRMRWKGVRQFLSPTAVSFNVARDLPDAGTLPTESVVAIQQSLDLVINAWSRYRATPYAGPLVLLRAAWGEKRRPGVVDADPQLGWGRWVQGGVQMEHLACWHSDVLRPEQATALAAILKKHMARPDAAGEGGGA